MGSHIIDFVGLNSLLSLMLDQYTPPYMQRLRFLPAEADQQ